MTNKQILEQAIQKAIDGGWTAWTWPNSADLLKWRWEDDDRVFSDGEYDDYETINVEAVIFNHDFAKALWGVQRCESACCGSAVTQRTLVNGKPIEVPWLSLLNEKGTKILSKYAVTHFHYCDNCKKKARLISYVGYKLHLQQMVISSDPIKYLGENI